MIFFDTETIGLHGIACLIQWARDDGEVHLHDVFYEPVEKTLELIEMFCDEEDGVCGFNLAFDWFHLCKLYTTFMQFQDRETIPIDHINEVAVFEERARLGPCVKPKKACDIMLHARHGEYQSTMERDDIRIKKVPTLLAHELAEELSTRIPIKDIYFARKKNKKQRWVVDDVTDDFGDIIPEFKDIRLSFAPSSGLKSLAADALGVEDDDILLFSNIEPDKHYAPLEMGYAPYALAPFKEKKTGKIIHPSPSNWHKKWPQVAEHYCAHWRHHRLARKYAGNDVIYTRDLWKFFGKPEAGDYESTLACMVGAVRWRGFKVDVEKMKQLRTDAYGKLHLIKRIVDFNSPVVCRKYLEQVLTDTEMMVMRENEKISTKKNILEEIVKWRDSEVCSYCNGSGTTGTTEQTFEEIIAGIGESENTCPHCVGGLIETDKPHPAAKRAQHILDGRRIQKEIELYDKILLADRFHASFKVIGTLSDRMAGSDGLNAQGIKHSTEVRECFVLADEGEELDGGDFDGFEVSIADAVYQDETLHKELTTPTTCVECGGSGCDICGNTGKIKYKIHALFGSCLFPTMTPFEITKSKNDPPPKDYYDRSKRGVFALMYGGEAYTLQTRVGVSESVAEEAYQKWISKYKQWGKARRNIYDKFCSMRQPNGLGTRVEWNDPAEYIESIFGFRRYFTLENRITKALYDLGEKPPKKWLELGKHIKVTRRDREQTSVGALRSALFAAAFAMQAACMRAAANHEIQSPGATITKKLQCEIWTLQPAGIHPWFVRPLNVHDEVMNVSDPIIACDVKTIVNKFVNGKKNVIPLIQMEWKQGLSSWADK